MQTIQPRIIMGAVTFVAALGLRALVGCEGRLPDEPLSAVGSSIVNGIPDPTGLPTAVFNGGGCSSVLIAPRTLLIAGHCFPQFTSGCQNLATAFANPLNFPLPELVVRRAMGWSGNPH